MIRRQQERTIRLVSALAYLLALAVSNLSHVHLHPQIDRDEVGQHCEHSCDHHGSGHADEADPGSVAQLADACHDSSEAPEAPAGHDDDCNICRFLGRPILLVRPFELVERSEHVTPLPAMHVPDVQPVTLVATRARAPPSAA